jgi:hypothetical protein
MESTEDMTLHGSRKGNETGAEKLTFRISATG